MKTNVETGRIGEDLACQYLQQKGYILLHRNWRFRKSEIDIICRNQEFTVFTEVKTKHQLQFGFPEAAVRRKKKELQLLGATEYMHRFQVKTQVRFDIIAILLLPEGPQIRHFEDAWFPYDL